MSLALLAGFALAEPGPTDHPYLTSVEVPASGTVRIDAGADLAGLIAEPLAQRLLLQNAAGQQVAYAVLSSEDKPEVPTERLFAQPVDEDTWQISGATRVTDTLLLNIDLNPGTFTTRINGGTPYLWHASDGGAELSLRVPPGLGPWTVDVGNQEVRLISSVKGRAHLPNRVEPHRISLPAPAPIWQEDGTLRYELRLPSPVQVSAVELQVDGDVFERTVTITTPNDGNLTQSSIQRVRIGGSAYDDTRIDTAPFVTDTLMINVATERGLALNITAFSIEAVGTALLVRDAGPGPLSLYAGATELAEPFSLKRAQMELLSLDPPRVNLPPLATNPNFQPIMTREGVDQPGREVDLTPFRWEASIEGPSGWVELTLSPEILALTSGDYNDLRVISASGLEIPYLPWSEGVTVTQALSFETEDIGTTTLLRAQLPAIAGPVGSVRLYTGRDTFRRSVSVLRDRGTMTEPIRSAQWEGSNQGRVLNLNLGVELGKELLIRIENGSNPSLPVEQVVATWSSRTIRFRLPDGGARLVFGSRKPIYASYDLELLRSSSANLPVQVATAGAPTLRAGPTQTPIERAVTLLTIGVLAVGLGAMAFRVVRAPEGEGA